MSDPYTAFPFERLKGWSRVGAFWSGTASSVMCRGEGGGGHISSLRDCPNRGMYSGSWYLVVGRVGKEVRQQAFGFLAERGPRFKTKKIIAKKENGGKQKLIVE